MFIIYDIILILLTLISVIEVFFIKKQKIIFFLLISILFFLCGFRYNVGPDYKSYKDIFLYIQNNGSSQLELFFYYINILYIKYKNGYIGVFATIAFLSIFLKSLTIYQTSRLPTTSLLFYYVTCYFNGDNGQIRQNLSISLCFYSTKYFFKNKIIFILLILLATMLHDTAFIFLLSLFAQINYIILIVFIFFVLFYIVGIKNIINHFILNLIPYSSIRYKYLEYLNSIKYGQYLPYTYGKLSKIVIFIFLLTQISKFKKKCKVSYLFSNLYFFSIFIYFIFDFNEIFATRLNLYYKIYEIIIFPNIIYFESSKYKKILYLFLYLIYCILLYINIYKVNSSLGKNYFSNYQNYFFI